MLGILVLLVFAVGLYMSYFTYDEPEVSLLTEEDGIQIEQLYDTLPVVVDVNTSETVLDYISKDDLYRSINRYVLVENNTRAGSIIFNNTLYVTVTAQHIETGRVYAKTEVKPIK